MGHARRLILVCLATAALPGCSPTRSTLTVEVRDAATGEPAPGVTVLADVPSRNHPFSVASLLGQTGPVSSRGTTDAKGVATVDRIEDRPFRLTIVPEGGTPESDLWDGPDEAWRILGPSKVRAR